MEENEEEVRDNLDAVNVLYDPEVALTGCLRIEQQWSIDDLDTLELWIAEHRADIVMIDSLRMASKSTGVDENSQAFAAPVYDLQSRLSMLKVSGYLIHHFNKNKEAGNLEKIAGNSALVGACNNIHTLLRVTQDRSDHTRQIQLDGRSCSGSFSIELTYDDFPHFHWDCHGETGVTAEDKSLKARVLKAIEANQKYHPEGVSATTLRETLEMSQTDRSLSRPLKALVKEGLVSTSRLEEGLS